MRGARLLGAVRQQQRQHLQGDILKCARRPVEQFERIHVPVYMRERHRLCICKARIRLLRQAGQRLLRYRKVLPQYRGADRIIRLPGKAGPLFAGKYGKRLGHKEPAILRQPTQYRFKRRCAKPLAR